MLSRAHAASVAALIAVIPLVPFGLWVYAKAASVDRGAVVARNEETFRRLSHPAGAVEVAAHTYPVYRWGNEGGFVPVDGYRTEFWLRLPRAVPKRTIRAYYRAALSRTGAAVVVEVGDTPGGTTREYAVYVSQ